MKLALALALVWILKWFNSAEDLVSFLNQLPAAQASSAKVIVAPSSRNFGGLLGSPYGLLYEEEKK